ncbi:hypothetical protein AUR64_13925 [Haloprofundus marisrubri]|uniref:Uncharacterized protein n=1 Tax=Haloprofundus marisrubri TaxID=1514971 RepID=A0A0W1R6B1_9EURY|nr:hypothetical protein [Haloprofundus marisrubri]KTG08905.1 hypothetical protein AUR64_13925 [Haloprofundus marisrubri]
MRLSHPPADSTREDRPDENDATDPETSTRSRRLVAVGVALVGAAAVGYARWRRQRPVRIEITDPDAPTAEESP